MFYKLFQVLDDKFGLEKASAHCDVPCGIYDPSAAQLAALTVVRMIDLMVDLEAKGGERSTAYHNSMSRYITVKEEHAEKAKHEIRRHRWITPGDHIAVALSGDKSSAALLYFLKKLTSNRRDISISAISENVLYIDTKFGEGVDSINANIFLVPEGESFEKLLNALGVS